MNYLCATLLALVVCSNVSAQIELGFRGGINLSNRIVIDGPEQDDMMLAGPFAGISARFGFNEKRNLTAELNYSVKGVHRKYSSTGVLGELTFRRSGEFTEELRYLEIPIMHNRFVKNWHFGVGGYFGYMLSGKITGEEYTLYSDFQAEVQEYDFDVLDSEFPIMNPVDFGVALGVSYIGNQGLGIQMRYTHGFANIMNAGFTTTRKTNLAVSIGIVFTPWKLN
jgi:hypothetical protein